MPLKRGDKWVARVKRNGKQQWLGTHATRKEALRAEMEWQHDPRTTETCDSFADRWVRDYPRAKESTNRINEQRVRKFADDFRGRLLGSITRPEARRWTLENPSCAAGVRAMHTDAMLDGLVDFNPFTGLKIPRSSGRRDKYILSEEEVHQLAAGARESHPEIGGVLSGMVLTMAYTGCRTGELFALEAKDMAGDFLNIRRQFSSHSRSYTTPKNGDERKVILPPQVRCALAEVKLAESGPMFRTARGKPWAGSSWSWYWRTIKANFGQADLDLYDLRHFCATWLKANGATYEQIARQLGHKDRGELARKLYAHPDEEGLLDGLLSVYKQGGDGVANPEQRPMLGVA